MKERRPGQSRTWRDIVGSRLPLIILGIIAILLIGTAAWGCSHVACPAPEGEVRTPACPDRPQESSATLQDGLTAGVVLDADPDLAETGPPDDAMVGTVPLADSRPTCQRKRCDSGGMPAYTRYRQTGEAPAQAVRYPLWS